MSRQKEELKALSVRQPWAWLIVNGHKNIENRSWKPSDKMIGQKIIIHASAKKVTKADFEEFLIICKERKIKSHPKSVEDFEYGSYVGSVILNNAVKNSKSYWAGKGNWHLVLTNAKKMTPVAKKGQLGFFPFK